MRSWNRRMWHLKCEYEAIYVRICIYNTQTHILHTINICTPLHFVTVSRVFLLLSRNSFHIFVATASASAFFYWNCSNRVVRSFVCSFILFHIFAFVYGVLLFISGDLSLCMRITFHLLLFSMFSNIIENVCSWCELCNNSLGQAASTIVEPYKIYIDM